MPLVIHVSCLRFFSVFTISILLTVQLNLPRSSTWDITAINLMAFFQYSFLSLFLHLMIYYDKVNSGVITVEDASS